MTFSVENNRGDCTENTAVDCQTAMPDFQDFDRIVFVCIPFKDHIIQARANDGDGHAQQQQIIQVIPSITKLFGFSCSISSRKQKTDAND